MKIVRLEAKNVLRLSAVTIDPTGNVIVLGGDNAQGKSSVLNCIEMALGGGNAIPAMPIKKGETKGHIVLDLGDIVVERRFSAKGTELTVKNGEGAKFPSPQRMLDELVGRLSFDPDSFRRMDRKQQRDTLMNLVGLDFTAIDERRKAAFDQRTEVNRRVKSLTTRLDSAPPKHDGVPEAEVSVKDLVAERDARQQLNNANAKRRDFLKLFDQGTEKIEAELPDLEAAIEQARAVLKAREEDLASAQQEIATRKGDREKIVEEVDALVDADISEITQQIDSAESTNRKVRENKARAALVDELKAEDARAAELTQRIADAEDEKTELLANAKFPVEGLGVNDDGVTLNGIPFEQSSGVESIKTCVAMGFAMNPKLKIVLVRNPSYIGEEYLRAITEIAEARDGQVWLERGGDGAECSVIIADGMVKEVRAPELVEA